LAMLLPITLMALPLAFKPLTPLNNELETPIIFLLVVKGSRSVDSFANLLSEDRFG